MFYTFSNFWKVFYIKVAFFILEYNNNCVTTASVFDGKDR